MNRTRLIALLPLLALAHPAVAQDRSQMSAPQPIAIPNDIPAARDVPYPGVMTLAVDATDTTRGIFRVKQTVPVAQGSTTPSRMTLLYPEWLPGKHGPRGAIAELTGLRISANGQPLRWTRDSYDVYAFHVDVPQGASQLDLAFEFLSPNRTSEGRINVTPEMMNVQWEQVALYPAGHFTRQIRVKPSITLPAGWTGIAALDGGVTTGDRVDYAVTDFETLVDSPMFAGRHFAKWDLGNNVTLNVVADEAKNLAAKPEHIEAHSRLVSEAIALFGGKHFDRYEFLLALTDRMGGIGLEHHRSSENSRERNYFTDWDTTAAARGLLPHELVHSWNGKFRRPEGLWTPDYKTPMKDNLLWVYEGQTSYWDLILGARSGIQPKDVVLGELARMAGTYAEQPGRAWRSVEDTTLDPIMAARKPKPNSSYSRGEDYYNEGSLTWLAADMKIRSLTGGRKSLDDFARAFFGIKPGDWGQVTYDFDEVVATLNGVAPYDWAGFLDTKLRQSGQPAPLEGIEAGGYRLVWKDTPNAYDADRLKAAKTNDLYHSLGFNLDKSGEVTSVLWDSPAFAKGVVNGMTIVAVNGVAYDADRLKEAVTAAKTGTPVRLMTKRGDRYDTIDIAYTGGLRYPHLEKIGTGTTPIDRLLEPLTGRRAKRN